MTNIYRWKTPARTTTLLILDGGYGTCCPPVNGGWCSLSRLEQFSCLNLWGCSAKFQEGQEFFLGHISKLIDGFFIGSQSFFVSCIVLFNILQVVQVNLVTQTLFNGRSVYFSVLYLKKQIFKSCSFLQLHTLLDRLLWNFQSLVGWL